MALPRMAARARRSLRILFAIVCFALLGAVVFVVGVFISLLGSVPLGNWDALLHVSILFAILGALYGTIIALDRSADTAPISRRFVRTFDAPLLRIVVCATLSGAAVIFVRSWHPSSFPVSWALVGTVVGGVLGWFGWRWAKYVEF